MHTGTRLRFVCMEPGRPASNEARTLPLETGVDQRQSLLTGIARKRWLRSGAGKFLCLRSRWSYRPVAMRGVTFRPSVRDSPTPATPAQWCDPPESRHLTVAETLCVVLSQRSYADRSNAANIRSTSRRDRRCSTMTTLDSRPGGTSASSRNVSMSASPATRRNRRSRAIRTSAWVSIAGYCISIHTLTTTDTPRGASRCHVTSKRPLDPGDVTFGFCQPWQAEICGSYCV